MVSLKVNVCWQNKINHSKNISYITKHFFERWYRISKSCSQSALRAYIDIQYIYTKTDLMLAASLLFSSSEPLDFRLVAMRLSSRPMPGASLLFRSSKPRDFGVARVSSIPLPATSLLFRSSKPLDFRLVARGCHQYHCRRRQSADLVSCTQIVVSTLVVVAARENSALLLWNISI